MVPAPRQTVTYWAISILNTRTFWINAGIFVVAVLSVADVAVLIPTRWSPVYVALVAAINVALRLGTVRPAVLIAPGKTRPIELPRLEPGDLQGDPDA